MSEFSSWRSYRNFEHAIKQQNRYIRDASIESFLATVLETGRKRIQLIHQGKYLWRAQLGYEWCEGDEFIEYGPAPHRPDRMKPLRGRAAEGRANPKGISYIYLATNRDTALAEVRPWIGSLISVGLFKTMRELRIINCTTKADDPEFYYYEDEPAPEERERAVWTHIDRAFARPVTQADDVADYVPTQIISELFKVNGYDGVAYHSSLGLGHNLALFDLEAVDMVKCSLFELQHIEFKFEEAANPYVVKKHRNFERERGRSPHVDVKTTSSHTLRSSRRKGRPR